MRHTISIINILLIALLFSCKSASNEDLNKALAQSKGNVNELKKAINHYKGEKREAIEFLIKHMPERDLLSLDAVFLIENVDYAYIARENYKWAQELDKEIFFNEVLPYASLNERRDRWRPDFYERFKKHIASSENIEEAIWAVNNNIFEELKVEYNTDRDKPDQSPYESMELGMASCSGLSILLVDAFRAVGIPARIAGTPNWFNNSGNHNWVEVFVNGTWHFTEYYATGVFDEAWFLERAAKADVNNPDQWMYASSFKPTNIHFPLVWDENIKYVAAENVTERYIQLYKTELANAKQQNAIKLQVIMLKNEDCSLSGNNRIDTEINLLSNNEIIESGKTSGSADDMNRYLTFNIPTEGEFALSYKNDKGELILKELKTATEDLQIILFHNQKL